MKTATRSKLIIIALIASVGSVFAEMAAKPFPGFRNPLNQKIASWPKKFIRYTAVGELSLEFNSKLDTQMAELASRTGLQLVRENPADIVFVFDERALIDIHENPQRLRYLGLETNIISSLQKQIPKPDEEGGKSCGATAFSNSDDDIVLSIGLTQNTNEQCVTMMMLVVLGVQWEKAEFQQGLNLACLLYKGRSLGARTVQAMLEKKSQLEAACPSTK